MLLVAIIITIRLARIIMLVPYDDEWILEPVSGALGSKRKSIGRAGEQIWARDSRAARAAVAMVGSTLSNPLVEIAAQVRFGLG